MLLRSLSQAQYRPDNEGHFGLAYDAYAHFTSPIRRYPDLLVHRAIKAVLAGTQYQPSGMTWPQLGVHTSMTERRADDAARDVTNWLKCYFMQDKVGEEFHGTISGVTGFGLFVTLDGLNIDGLVHITELGRDYFHFDAGKHALIGERSGLSFQLAGRLRVKVARVDLETTKIDFTLAEDAAVEAPPSTAQRPVFAEPLSRDSRPAEGQGAAITAGNGSGSVRRLAHLSAANCRLSRAHGSRGANIHAPIANPKQVAYNSGPRGLREVFGGSSSASHHGTVNVVRSLPTGSALFTQLRFASIASSLPKRVCFFR